MHTTIKCECVLCTNYERNDIKWLKWILWQKFKHIAVSLLLLWIYGKKQSTYISTRRFSLLFYLEGNGRDVSDDDNDNDNINFINYSEGNFDWSRLESITFNKMRSNSIVVLFRKAERITFYIIEYKFEKNKIK